MQIIDSALARLRPRTFRSKFILIVGAVVVLSVVFYSTLARYDANRLARDATLEIESGLTRASKEYLTNYIQTTALRVDAIIEGTHAEERALASGMQNLIDRPATSIAIGNALVADRDFNPTLVYDQKGNWSQNLPGAPSVLSVWGYLLGPDRRPLPAVQKLIRETAAFDAFSTPLMTGGARKLQVYFVGPKDKPIMRTTPYAYKAQTFDKLYAGHNSSNWWDFFFPGVYEGWLQWLLQTAASPVPGELVTMTAPYVDAITGKLIISYFHPLWTPDRSDVQGLIGIDVTLDQLSEIVQSVKVADTGFAFLSTETGNVLAVRPEGELAMGLVTASAKAGQCVTCVDRTLGKSSQPSIRSLRMPADEQLSISTVSIRKDGVLQPHIIALQRLSKRNLWDGKVIVGSQLVLGFVVPQSEVYATMTAARTSVDNSLQQILKSAALAGVLMLLALLAVIVAISKPIAGSLQELARAARRLKDKDYSVRIDNPSNDEFGEVGVAFNRMAEDISYHTENLENLVKERTSELAAASEEIVLLNGRLKQENQRLGSEVDVARRMQMMVLPKRHELDAVSQLDIATYMEPADEVGGDYYDVLSNGQNVKIGIGDVTGHGLESGVLMLMVQSVARALEEQGESDPKLFLSVLNRVIYKNIVRTESDKHLTLAFIDIDGHGSAVLSGQHEQVIVVRSNGSIELIDTNDLGFPVGLEPDISQFVSTRTLQLGQGDVLVLHTDGVTEAEDPMGGFYGIGRLCESAGRHAGGSADSIKNGIIGDLMVHIASQKIHDDITLVVAKQR